MITDKAHFVGDVCYMIYNNKLTKVIITAEITVRTRSVIINTKADINVIRNSPSLILNYIKDVTEDLYNVSIIPENDETLELIPIQGAFYADVLYDSKEDLLFDLGKQCQ